MSNSLKVLYVLLACWLIYFSFDRLNIFIETGKVNWGTINRREQGAIAAMFFFSTFSIGIWMATKIIGDFLLEAYKDWKNKRATRS